MQTSLACRSPRWPLMAKADPSRPGPGQFRSMATSQALSVCLSVLGSWLKTAAASPSKESWEEGVGVDSDSLNLALSNSKFRTTWGQERVLVASKCLAWSLPQIGAQ